MPTEEILEIYSVPKTNKVLQKIRLAEYLSEKKVTILSAAPGLGKSTSVAVFIESRGLKYCWINLDESIDTSGKFLNILSSGIEKQFSEIWKTGPAEKDSEKIKMLMKHASKHHSPKNPFCIVIDNFEKSNSRIEIQQDIENLCLDAANCFRFYLISRKQTSYSFRKIRAAKELIELRNSDFMMQPEELKKLFTEVYKIPLSEGDYEKLYAITDGWVCALVFLLERLVLQPQSERQNILQMFYARKTLPEIDDYIRNEVLVNQTAKNLKLITLLNHADQICPELVEEFAETDGKNFLTSLENENLFIIIQDQTLYTYRFCSFFSEYLNREFEKMGEDEKKEALIKLSRYYEQNNTPHAAIQYLLESGETEKAYSYLAEYAEELLQSGEYENIRFLLSHFSEEEIKTDLLLTYYHAISNSILHPEEAHATLLKLLPKIKKSGNCSQEAMVYTVLLTSSFFYQRSRLFIVEITEKASTFLKKHGEDIAVDKRELLTTLLPLGEWWTSPARSEVFEAALRAEEISHRFHNREAFLCARLVLCRIYLERGDFREARHILIKTENLIKTEDRYSNLRYYRTLLSFYKGDALFSMGEINEAISEVQKGLSFAPKDFSFLPYLQLNLILYNLYLDNIEKGESLYNDLRDDPHGENVYLRFYFDYFFKLVIAYRNNNVRRTDFFCRRLLAPENESILKSDYPYTLLTLTETLIFLQDYKSADNLLQRIRLEFSTEDYPYTTATALGLYALLESRKKNHKKAKEYAAEMTKMLKKSNRNNIEICNPEILKEINNLSDGSMLSDCPRLIMNEELVQADKHTKPLEIYTLGQFRVFIEGKEISSTLLSSQKRVMDLMKFLIVFRKNGVMKERIYELFWPRYSYKSARDNLNTIIYRLRKMMGDSKEFLLTDVNSIQFNPEYAFIDVDRFQDYLSSAQNAENIGKKDLAVKLYRECIASYPGEFLKGDLYYDFIRDERENLQGKFRTALFRLVQLSLYMEEYIEAIEWAKKLVESDPLCEAAYRLLMVCSAYIGSRSEIPRLYDKLNKKLQTYYRIQADEKTLELKNKLISGTLPTDSDWTAETII